MIFSLRNISTNILLSIHVLCSQLHYFANVSQCSFCINLKGIRTEMRRQAGAGLLFVLGAAARRVIRLVLQFWLQFWLQFSPMQEGPAGGGWANAGVRPPPVEWLQSAGFWPRRGLEQQGEFAGLSCSEELCRDMSGLSLYIELDFIWAVEVQVKLCIHQYQCVLVR